MSSEIESGIRNSADTHKRVARNMVFVSLFMVIGKLAGAGKEVAIAYRFGVSEVVDLYVFVFTIAMWLPSMWSSVSTSTIVPLTNLDTGARKSLFHSELMGWIGIVGLVLSVASLVAIPYFSSHLMSQFSVSSGVVVCLVCLIAAAYVSMFIMHFNALLLVLERHMNTLLNGVPALGLLVFVLWNPFDVELHVLAVGALVGVFAHCAILIYLLRDSMLISWPKLTFQSNSWAGFRSAFGIVFLSTVVIGLTPIIDQFIAASLDTGSVSKLGFASRLLALFLGIGATGIGRSILPVLSSQSEQSTQIALTIRWYFILLIAGCLLMIIAWLSANEMVRLMYERGAFTSSDTEAVAGIFKLALIQVPFYFSGIVLVQYFTSRKYYWTLFYSSCVAVIVKIISAPILAERLGVEGISLSTGLMYVGTFTFLTILFFRDRWKTSQ